MNNELSEMVSNKQIMKKLKGYNIKIMVYSELNNYDNLLDILNSKLSACFILLRTTNNSGHWTIVLRYYDNIIYFDSYGVKPDGEMNKIPSEERIELNENDKQLTKLISTIPKDFTFQYNNIQFQQFKNGINTCGKWTSSFCYCIFKGMSLKDFQTKMKNLKKEYKLSYDVLICLIWDDI